MITQRTASCAVARPAARWRQLVPALIAWCLCCSCVRDDVTTLIHQAVVAADSGDTSSWKRALRLTESCVKNGLTDANVVTFYVICLYHTGRREQAKQVAKDGLEQDGGHFMLNYWLGKMFYEDHLYLKAFDHLGACRSHDPEHLDTLILAANCALELQHPVAGELFADLVGRASFQHAYLAHNGLGVCRMRDGDFRHALSSFSRALALSGGHPLILLNMAVLNDRHLSKPKIAATFYQRFLDTAGDNYHKQRRRVTARLKQLSSMRAETESI